MDFVVLWGCVFEALGLIVDDFLVPWVAKSPYIATGGQKGTQGGQKAPLFWSLRKNLTERPPRGASGSLPQLRI